MVSFDIVVKTIGIIASYLNLDLSLYMKLETLKNKLITLLKDN